MNIDQNKINWDQNGKKICSSFSDEIEKKQKKMIYLAIKF